MIADSGVAIVRHGSNAGDTAGGRCPLCRFALPATSSTAGGGDGSDDTVTGDDAGGAGPAGERGWR
jgi:hypothetical protein